MIITDEQRAEIRAALTSPDLNITGGIGDATAPGEGEACTIAEINLVLTGKLGDGPHPCMCEVIRRWVIRIQDAMPHEMRNSPEWRNAAVGIAGSRASDSVELRRVDLLREWMWCALGDEDVVGSIPESARPAWDRMLADRTPNAANAAIVAAAASASAYAAAVAYAADAVAIGADGAASAYAAAVAVAYAADAVASGAIGAGAAYWRRRDPAGTLAALIAITEQ